jgi:hypothetical protein
MAAIAEKNGPKRAQVSSARAAILAAEGPNAVASHSLLVAILHKCEQLPPWRGGLKRLGGRLYAAL